MFGFFKKREHPERRALRERFEGVVNRLRTEDLLVRAAVGHALNLANSFFIQRFMTVAAFEALPSDDKKAYIEALTGVEKKFLENGDHPSALGFALFGDWIAVVAEGDEPLARQFREGLAEVSRLGDAFLGPISRSPNQEPRPAGYDQMTEEQRELSARFIREHNEREMRTAGAPAALGPLEEAQRAYKAGNYPTALGLLRPLADNGNASAQLTLGVIYAKGQDQKDYDRTMAMYRRAAEKGLRLNLKAQYRGVCMQPDFVVAHKWFNLAASNFTEAAKRTIALQSLAQIASKMTQAQIAEAEARALEWKASRSSEGK